ncbi:MAG TPA: type II toxin-antitoxin system VapC family toxin [Rhizomicrobium sp.]|jgi:predicted nucleic acid-binding protein|nr:type II toxin-antitoxin system VapC family toxin [Rhizomicrobium sp.]
MFILDTNVVSELRKVRSSKANANVARWADTVEAVALYISSITVLELERGVLLIERRDAKQGRILRTWFDNHVMPEFADRILPVDAAVALRCARLHVPNPQTERDALIASTALVHGMTVVTRNVDDFKTTGVGVLNPWTFKGAND